MPFETIRKNSAPEMVAEQILRQIRAGELPPGAQLPPQRDLAALLGVGRSSVREAINALAVMGYLEPVQGRGTFIRADLPGDVPTTAALRSALEAGSILDLMEAREVLECKSAALAAERAGAGQIRELEKMIRAMENSASGYEPFLEADMAFHTFLAEMTDNGVIREMTRLVLEKVRAHHARFRTAHLSADYRTNSICTAAAVVESIGQRDAAAAMGRMREHLDAIRGELKHVVA